MSTPSGGGGVLWEPQRGGGARGNSPRTIQTVNDNVQLEQVVALGLPCVLGRLSALALHVAHPYGQASFFLRREGSARMRREGSGGSVSSWSQFA